MAKVVLIAGETDDPHVQRVATALEDRRATPIVFDPRAHGRSEITYAWSGAGWQLTGSDADTSFSGADVCGVWWRLKPSLDDPASSTEPARFGAREWRHALEGLESVVPQACWINPRAVDRRTRYKLVQLVEAARSGLSVPATLITNDPRRLSQTLALWGDEAIYKPLSRYFQAPDKLLFTNRIDRKLVEEREQNIEAAPGIFQPLIKKAYELRVTCVGRRAFAVRIESQRSGTTSLDWRRDYDSLQYAACKLAPELEKRLLALHCRLGLVFAAYDFIVTPQGEHIFLEVNPAGQWLWLEEATGIPVTGALVDMLLQDNGLSEACAP